MMVDLSHTVAPKSDQLNADDLLAGPITITVARVTAAETGTEQPVAIHWEGGDGRPYKPCKSMRRVLIACWGANGADYAGRSMTLFHDPSVKYGGIAVGGIRISHLSDIDGRREIMLTVTKQKRAPWTILPLAPAAPVYFVGDERFADLVEWKARFDAVIAGEKFTAAHAARALRRHAEQFQKMQAGSAGEQAAANAVITALQAASGDGGEDGEA